jgi:hypothetical protein
MRTIKCECGFEEEVEPDEFGLSWFQVDGTCPWCDKELCYEDGTKTVEVIKFKLVEVQQ